MTEFTIIPVANGFEVCRLEKVVLGSFPREKEARLFEMALRASQNLPVSAGGAVKARIAAQTATAKPAPETKATPGAQQVEVPEQRSEVAAPAPVEVAQSKPAEEATPAAREGPTTKTHPELFAKAHARLMDGEPVKTVADDLDIPLGRLRGWWAAKSKGATDDGSAPDAVARKNSSGWTDVQDEALLKAFRAADPEAELFELAHKWGRRIVDCEARAERLIRQGMPQ